MMKMRHLQRDFNNKGWHFEQIIRNEKAAIYKRICIDTPTLVYYEAISIQKQRAKRVRIRGQEVAFEEKEVYPRDDQFGTYGKCCMSLDRAIVYLLEFSMGENAD